MQIVPISLKEANEFVRQYHRHHKPKRIARFAVAVAKEDEIVGVAIIGNPVARHLCDGWTLEVNRVATDGTKNACSMLYGASWRVAREMGYRRLITYTLPSEGGGSLRGAGWNLVGERGGGSWNCPSRPRIDMAPTQKKLLWETTAAMGLFVAQVGNWFNACG